MSDAKKAWLGASHGMLLAAVVDSSEERFAYARVGCGQQALMAPFFLER